MSELQRPGATGWAAWSRHDGSRPEADELTIVHWIKLDAGGIRFGRRFGSPRYLAWERIRSIRPASSWEVVARGWLWPFFLPREATKSWTSEGQYRIDYPGGFCFFPPDDPAAFHEAVARWRPELVVTGRAPLSPPSHQPGR